MRRLPSTGCAIRSRVPSLDGFGSNGINLSRWKEEKKTRFTQGIQGKSICRTSRGGCCVQDGVKLVPNGKTQLKSKLKHYLRSTFPSALSGQPCRGECKEATPTVVLCGQTGLNQGYFGDNRGMREGELVLVSGGDGGKKNKSQLLSSRTKEKSLEHFTTPQTHFEAVNISISIVMPLG